MSWKEKLDRLNSLPKPEPVYIIRAAAHRSYFYAIAEHAIDNKLMTDEEHAQYYHRLNAVTVMGAFREAIAMGLNVDRFKWIDGNDRTQQVMFKVGD